MTIWKFPIRITDRQIIEIPVCNKIMHVGLDPRGDLCFWAEVQPDSERVKKMFYVVGTGGRIPGDSMGHLGSITMGPFVWHLYQGPAQSP